MGVEQGGGDLAGDAAVQQVAKRLVLLCGQQATRPAQVGRHLHGRVRKGTASVGPGHLDRQRRSVGAAAGLCVPAGTERIPDGAQRAVERVLVDGALGGGHNVTDAGHQSGGAVHGVGVHRQLARLPPARPRLEQAGRGRHGEQRRPTVATSLLGDGGRLLSGGGLGAGGGGDADGGGVGPTGGVEIGGEALAAGPGLHHPAGDPLRLLAECGLGAGQLGTCRGADGRGGRGRLRGVAKDLEVVLPRGHRAGPVILRAAGGRDVVGQCAQHAGGVLDGRGGVPQRVGVEEQRGLCGRGLGPGPRLLRGGAGGDGRGPQFGRPGRGALGVADGAAGDRHGVVDGGGHRHRGGQLAQPGPVGEQRLPDAALGLVLLLRPVQLGDEGGDALLPCGGPRSGSDVLGGRLGVPAVQRARGEPAVIGHPERGAGGRTDTDSPQHSSHGSADVGPGRHQQRRQVRGNGWAPHHQQLTRRGDHGSVLMDRRGEQPGGLTGRLQAGAARVVEIGREVDQRGEQRLVGRGRGLPPGPGERQLLGGADGGQLGGQPAGGVRRAFDPQSGGAEHRVQGGIEGVGGCAGLHDAGAGHVAQLRASGVGPGWGRQPARGPAGCRGWHCGGVPGQPIRPGQDGVAVPLAGRLGAGAGLSGALPFPPGRRVGVIGLGECRGGRAVRLLGAAQQHRDVGDLPAAGSRRVGCRPYVDTCQRVAVGPFDSVVDQPCSEHGGIRQREPDGPGPRMPLHRRHAVPDPGQIAIEPATVAHDPIDRLPRPLLRAGLLNVERVRLRLEAGDVIAAGQQGLQLAVGGGRDQAGQRRLGARVVAAQPRHLVGEPLLLGAGRVGGGARPAAHLQRRPSRGHGARCPVGGRQQDAPRILPVGVEDAAQCAVGLRQRGDVESVALQVFQRLGGVGDGVFRHRWECLLQAAREIGIDPVSDPRVPHLVQQRKVTGRVRTAEEPARDLGAVVGSRGEDGVGAELGAQGVDGQRDPPDGEGEVDAGS